MAFSNTKTSTACTEGVSRPSVAVIGSGIAGLTAAWLLKETYSVTLYEAQAAAGMGVHTVNLAQSGSEVDVPLRIFCEGYYANLFALYRTLGVKLESSDHSGIFFSDAKQVSLHYGRINILGRLWPFPKGRSLFTLSSWQLIVAQRHFYRNAKTDAKCLNRIKALTFAEYLESRAISPAYIEKILLPLLSVTCTCDYQSVLNYPADIIVEYLTSGVAKLGILNAEYGVKDIVSRLLKGVHLQTDSAIQRIMPDGQKVKIEYNGLSQTYDQVIVATQVQQAAKMLDGFLNYQQYLQQVPVESSVMMVHQDASFLPRTACRVSPVSYFTPAGSQRPQISVDLSKSIRRFRSDKSLFQTWHPIYRPPAEKILAEISFTRPCITHASRDAIHTLCLAQKQPGNRLWLCGSYMTPDKIPLLDAAVTSALEVAAALGVSAPWLKATA